jgi:hypothetical protein
VADFVLLSVASQNSLATHKAEWTPFQTHYVSENLVALGIEPETSGYIARNSDHWTTEAVYILLRNI